MRRKASNTARGTLERRRPCGFFPEFSAGLLDLAASRAPSDFISAGASAEMTRAQTRRENDGGCLKTELVNSACDEVAIYGCVHER